MQNIYCDGRRARNISALIAAVMSLLVVGFTQQVTKQFSQSDLINEAMRTAGSVRDPASRSRAWCNIAKALIPFEKRQWRNALVRAIRSAEQINDPFGKAMQIYDVAMTLTDADKSWARKVISDVLKVTEQMDTPSMKAFVIRMFVHPLSKVNVSEALSVARRIPDPLQKGLALGYVCEELAKQKPDEAFSIAEGIADPYSKVIALAAIGRVARDKQQASKALSKAIAIAMTPLGGQVRDTMLRTIAEQMADVETERVLEMARKIETPVHKAWALSAVAKVMVKRKNQAKASQILSEALAVVAKETNPREKVIALRPIATTLAMLNKQRALNLFDQQFELAQRAGEAKESAAFLRLVITDLAPIDPKKAYALATKIKDARERDAMLCAIAEGLAAGDVQQAIRIANEIKDASIRAVALARIATKISPAKLGQGLSLPLWAIHGSPIKRRGER